MHKIKTRIALLAVLTAMLLAFGAFNVALAAGDTAYENLTIDGASAVFQHISGVSVTDTLLISGFAGRVEIDHSTIKRLVVEGADAEPVIVLGTKTQVESIVITGKARLVENGGAAAEVEVTGEAELLGTFAQVSLAKAAKMQIAEDARVAKLAMEAGAQAHVGEKALIEAVTVSPVEGMENAPAYIALSDEAHITAVHASGMLDIGVGGTVEACIPSWPRILRIPMWRMPTR